MAMLGTRTAEVVEEPTSGTLVPLVLDDGKVLLGIALKTKYFAVMHARIFVFAVYGAPEDFLHNASSDSVPTASALLAALLISQAEKVISLTFLRNISGKQLQEGLTDDLSNVGKVPRDDVDLLVSSLPDSVSRGTELRLIVHPQQAEVALSISRKTFTICNEQLCRGIHEMYFGPQSTVPGLGEALQRQRWLLVSRGFLPGSKGLGRTDSDLMDLPSSSASTAKPDTVSFQTPEKTKTQSMQKQADSNITYAADEKESWPAALVAEGEDAAWVMVGNDAMLDADGVAAQNLTGCFFKHHGSAVRGRFLPQWSARHYELVAGILRYRRRAEGRICGEDSLNGARVISETPKFSRAGNYFVFRVMAGDNVICRLSSPDRHLAAAWVSAITGACAYFRALRAPAEEPRLQLVAQPCQEGQEPSQVHGIGVTGPEEREEEQWEIVEPVDANPSQAPNALAMSATPVTAEANAASVELPVDDADKVWPREEVCGFSHRPANSNSLSQLIITCMKARLLPVLITGLLFIIGLRLRRRAVALR